MTPQDNHQHEEISDKLQDTVRVTAALKQAARQAILSHAQAGVPIVVWRNQQVVSEDAQARPSANLKSG